MFTGVEDVKELLRIFRLNEDQGMFSVQPSCTVFMYTFHSHLLLLVQLWISPALLSCSP